MKCSSTVSSLFPREMLGGDKGQIRARVCFDEGCKSFQGRLGTVGARSETLEIWQVTKGVIVSMELPPQEYDASTPHRVTAELQVEDNDPVAIKRSVSLRRFRTGGRSCSPTCWRARVRADRI